MKNRKYYPYVDTYIKPSEGAELSKEEQREMIKKIRNGDADAKKRFLETYFPFIEKIAKKYATSYISVDDLIQEGYLGYENAISSFDLSSTCQFSTYACAHIFKTVSVAAWTNLYGFSFTRKEVDVSMKYNKVFSELSDSLGRKPTIEELAKHMKITPKSVKNIQYIQKVSHIISLEEEMKSSKNRRGTEFPKLKDCIEDTTFSVEDPVFVQEMQKDVQNLLEIAPLSEKTKEMLILHYAMEQSSYQIGKIYGMTGAAVRDREKRAFKTLRNMALNRKMNMYLDLPEESGYENEPVMQKKR